MSEAILDCEDCGKVSDDVHDTICPFAWEINDVQLHIRVCQHCYDSRRQDI